VIKDTIWRDGKNKFGVPYSFDPMDLSDQDLADLFTGKKNNFIAYIGGLCTDQAHERVRVNGKIRGRCTQITFPPYMEGYIKSSIGLRNDETTWSTLKIG
jgi:hypothetical protein